MGGWQTLLVGACLLVAVPVGADPTADRDDPHALLATYHEDPARIDRARALLEREARGGGSAATFVALSRACYLFGEFRATSGEARLAAFERGREAGRRAVETAPSDDAAHVWYAINSGRWAEAKGLFRAVVMLRELRKETELILKLNPASVEGNTIMGSMLAELPGMLGGDRALAEQYFGKALQVEPRCTGPRVERARLYIAEGRREEAIGELRKVCAEKAPSDPPFWTLRDEPLARKLLASLGAPAAPEILVTGARETGDQPLPSGP